MKIAKLLLIFAVLICINAQAVIIEGSFKGTISEYHDATSDCYYLCPDCGVDEDCSGMAAGYRPVINRDIKGQTVTGNFTYDTEIAPPGRNSTGFNYPNETTYYSKTNSWLDLNFVIDGEIFEISKNTRGLEPLEHPGPAETISIRPHDPAVNLNGTHYFNLMDESIFGDYSNDYENKSGRIEIQDSQIDFLNGVGLEQQFSWIYRNDGIAALNRAIFSTTGQEGDYSYFAKVNIILSEVTLRVRKESVVSEPPTLMLCFLAMMGLCALPRRVPQ